MTNLARLPWMKFYSSDWRGEACLRVCSLAARGLWIELLTVMHEATPRGSLVMNGRPMTIRQISALVGGSIDEVTGLLAELRDSAVFSEDDDGTIYSRRMRKDDKKAREDKENGSKGGNPSLKPWVNPPDKAQRLEARDQIPDIIPPPSITAEGEGEGFFEKFYEEFPKDKASSKPKAREAFDELSPDEQRALADSAKRIADHVRGQKLSRPYNVAAFIRERRFEGLIAGPTEAAEGVVLVRQDTPQWRAWIAVRGRAPPVQNGGWYFPSEWPPEYAEQRAS